jgi:hypothetical protein
MTTLRDVHAWLDTPGGHVFQAECGGRSQALAALIEADQAARDGAYALNQERQRNGLDALPADAAMTAVRPRGGPQVSGRTDDVKAQFRDPSWRVKVGTDEAEHAPVRWDGQAQGWINFVNSIRR